MDGRSIIQMSHREMEKQTVGFFLVSMDEDGILLIPPFRTEITLGNCCLVQKVSSKYMRQVSQS